MRGYRKLASAEITNQNFLHQIRKGREELRLWLKFAEAGIEVEVSCHSDLMVGLLMGKLDSLSSHGVGGVRVARDLQKKFLKNLRVSWRTPGVTRGRYIFSMYI